MLGDFLPAEIRFDEIAVENGKSETGELAIG
jgi:hypothetical protein